MPKRRTETPKVVESMEAAVAEKAVRKYKPTKKEKETDSDELRATRRRCRGARAKGHSFEREIANSLKPIFPEARRLLENHKDDARGVDILHTGAYRFQCKRLRKYCNPNKIEEVQCDEMLGEVPVLVTQGDRKRILAVLPFEELLRLLKMAEG